MTARPTRSAYPYHTAITTRWSDNDIYGHVNNVTYYSYFDTAANLYLIQEGGLDITSGTTIGLVVESHCQFFAPVAYPDELEAGVRVDKLGNRSVTYGVAVFVAGHEHAAASGYVVHVFVDRATREAVAIPEGLRHALVKLKP